MALERSAVSTAVTTTGPAAHIRSGKKRQGTSSAQGHTPSFASYMQESPLPSAKAQPLKKAALGYSVAISPSDQHIFSFNGHETKSGESVSSQSSAAPAPKKGRASRVTLAQNSVSAKEAQSAEAVLQHSFSSAMVSQGNKRTIRSGSVRKYDFGMEDTRNRRPIGMQSTNPTVQTLKSQPSSSLAAMGGQGNYGQLEQAVHSAVAHSGSTPRASVDFSFNQPMHPANTPNLATFAKVLEHSTTPIRTINSGQSFLVGDVPIREAFKAKGEEGARIAVQAASHRRKGSGMESSLQNVFSFTSQRPEGLGALAAKFESGSEGIAAIGYDRNGGTSYGKFQISSRAGTMRSFITYLREEAPDIAKRLAAAGSANTGSKYGTMPSVWKKIAQEAPARFEQLQNDFIKTSHFEPAIQSIAVETGVAFDTLPNALQEVLFSTAVQHGPSGAARIVGRAVNKVDATPLQNPIAASATAVYKAGKELIQEIYNLRAGQFGSSTRHVQSAAQNRLQQEMNEALAMFRV